MKFDHTKSSFFQACGFTEEEVHWMHHMILFKYINTRINIEKLYDDVESEAPVETITKSGILEMCYNCTEERLHPLLLITFYQSYDNITESLGAWIEYKKSKKEGKKSDVGQLILDAAMKIRLLPVMGVVEKVKQSKGNFDKFMELVDAEDKDDPSPIEKLMRNLFRKKGDSEEE